LQAHQTTIARPLNLVRPEVPVELAAVVAKMMAKEPSRRYQKPVEVAQALMSFLTKAEAKGPGAKADPSPSIPMGERVKAEPRRSEPAARRSETIAPTPSKTLRQPAKAADPFSFAPDPLVHNPLAKKARPRQKLQSGLNHYMRRGVWCFWG
jgi:hypothetical protein